MTQDRICRWLRHPAWARKMTIHGPGDPIDPMSIDMCAYDGPLPPPISRFLAAVGVKLRDGDCSACALFQEIETPPIPGGPRHDDGLQVPVPVVPESEGPREADVGDVHNRHPRDRGPGRPVDS